MALYGDYRPKTFSDMVGQDAPKNTLLNAIRLGRLSHAYLFCGTRGTGKTSSARILAKAINCTNITETGDPCTQCELCILAETDRLTDIIEIDAASNRGIDEIRDLREKVSFAPNTGKAKIYIIDEVHMLTKEAFNALLKTLEEPPHHAYFILATTEYHKVPDTIRSRCQTFFFTNIEKNDIVDRLQYICTKENFEYTQEGLEIIAKRANGGLRDAISLLEQSSTFGPITAEHLQQSLGIISADFLETFLTHLQKGHSNEAFAQLEALQNEGRNIQEFGKDFLEYLQEIFHQYIAEKNALLPWIIEVITLFEEGLQRSKRFEIPPLALEIAITKTLLLNKEFTNQLTHISSHTTTHTEENITNNTPAKKEKEKEKEKENNQSPSIEKTTDDLSPPPIPSSQQSSQENPPWDNETTQTIPSNIIPKNEKDSHTTENQNNHLIQQQKENNTIDPIDPPEPDEILPIVQSQWKTLCSMLPKTVKLYLSEYGSAIEYTDGILTIEIKGDFAKKLINTEKNITLMREKFSYFLNTNLQIHIHEKQETTANTLSHEEVEGLLQF